MTNTIGLKKKLLVCLLAAAMGASAVTGGVLLDASAESVALTNLVTVTGDAQVQTAPQQYKLKNNGKDGTPAGTAVGDTGLYVASTKDDSADGYTVALNGIFTGSVGMQIAFPGEGFWDGSYREAVMTVASINDPAEQFQLHLDDVWGMYAYVTYDYEGQTLVRSRSKYYGDPFDPVTGSETGDWLYYKDTDSYYFPVMGVFQDAGTKADPRRETSYFGLEMTADGALNVILTANKGDWGEPYKRVLASFAEDPETFEPKMEGKGSTPNLPKLESFKDGYTISFEVSDNANNKACDFLLESIAVSNSGDAYRSENNGTVYTLNTETLDAPSFYTKWKTTPMLTFGDYEYLNSVAVGEEVELPEVSVVLAGQPSVFTGTITVTDSEGTQDASNGKYTVRNSGKHTVNYTQGTAQITISFNALDEAFSVDDVTQDVQGAQISYDPDIRNLQGITLKGTNGGFSGKLAGSFSGNMSIDFEFPQQFNDANTGNGAKFTFTVYDPNGNAAFDIVYENAGGWYTAVYVKMGDNIRTFIEDGSYDGWSGE